MKTALLGLFDPMRNKDICMYSREMPYSVLTWASFWKQQRCLNVNVLHAKKIDESNYSLARLFIAILPSEDCAYKGVINDRVIMQAIMRANAHFGLYLF